MRETDGCQGDPSWMVNTVRKDSSSLETDRQNEDGNMRSDIDIKRDVEAELRWNPDIDATDIAVAVKNGVVTLAGFVRRYAQKLEAEQTAKRVTGVVAVANDIEVRLPIFNQR